MKQQGYATWTEAAGSLKESDTFTCCHCNTVIFIHPVEGVQRDLGGFCRNCMKNICGPCADNGRCTPFEKLIDEYEKRSRLLASIGIKDK